MAHPQARADVRGGRLAGARGEQRIEVQRRGAGVVAEARGPALAREVGGQLDAVAVGIGQVDRFVGPVVGRALDVGVRGGHAHGRACEFLAAGIQQRVMERSGVPAGPPRLRVLVQDEDSGGAVAEFGERGYAGMQPQSEHALIPRDGAIEVGDREIDGPETQRGRERGGGLNQGHAYKVDPAPRARNGRTARMYGRLALRGRAAAPGRPSGPRRGGA